MLFLALLPRRTPSSPHAPGSGSNSLHCVMRSAHLESELHLWLLTERLGPRGVQGWFQEWNSIRSYGCCDKSQIS